MAASSILAIAMIAFFAASTFLERKVAIADLWELFGSNGTQSALNKQRFDVGSSPADPGGFLLPGAFIVLRRKARPRSRDASRWGTRTYPLQFQK